MTPTSTSYTIPASLSGYGANQAINPSELNLWRVIKKNEDGTVDVVSEYVSSTPVYFRGRTGYPNFAGTLNTIAAQYTNEKYVSSTRHMVAADHAIVDQVYETMVGYTPSGGAANYWLANTGTQWSGPVWVFYQGYLVNTSGVITKTHIYSLYEDKLKDEYTAGCTIRPILTLKSTVELEGGDGTSDSPYMLN